VTSQWIHSFPLSFPPGKKRRGEGGREGSRETPLENTAAGGTAAALSLASVSLAASKSLVEIRIWNLSESLFDIQINSCQRSLVDIQIR
jgi:hypothetical protein